MRRLVSIVAGLSVALAGAAFAQSSTQPADPALPKKPDHSKDNNGHSKKHDEKKADSKSAEKKTDAKGTEKKADSAAPAPGAPAGSVAVGAPAPEWTLKDAEGKEHKLSDYKGKVVVMDFWATWCGPCKKAMPDVQKIHEQFKDKSVVVIGISTSEQGTDAEKVSMPASYMRGQKFTYNLFVKGEDAAKAYGVTGIPAFFVVGPDGKIVLSEVGYDPSNHGKITAAIEKALHDKT